MFGSYSGMAGWGYALLIKQSRGSSSHRQTSCGHVWILQCWEYGSANGCVCLWFPHRSEFHGISLGSVTRHVTAVFLTNRKNSNKTGPEGLTLEFLAGPYNRQGVISRDIPQSACGNLTGSPVFFPPLPKEAISGIKVPAPIIRVLTVEYAC
jgi:hypothetical protein